jgi:NAD(P)H-dependent FMN reductase
MLNRPNPNRLTSGLTSPMGEGSIGAEASLQFTIISCSPRRNSQSSKVAHYIGRHLDSRNSILDLAVEKLPEWHEGYWGRNDIPKEWAHTSRLIGRSDGIIFVVPEWNGMVPPAAMNLFLLCSNGELAHKPGLIVSVTSGQGGAYPIAQLRVSGSKNTQICYVPDHVVVRNVENVLNERLPHTEDDERIRERLEYSINLFICYSKALRQVRESGLIDLRRFPYGM